MDRLATHEGHHTHTTADEALLFFSRCWEPLLFAVVCTQRRTPESATPTHSPAGHGWSWMRLDDSDASWCRWGTGQDRTGQGEWKGA